MSSFGRLILLFELLQLTTKSEFTFYRLENCQVAKASSSLKSSAWSVSMPLVLIVIAISYFFVGPSQSFSTLAFTEFRLSGFRKLNSLSSFGRLVLLFV